MKKYYVFILVCYLGCLSTHSAYCQGSHKKKLKRLGKSQEKGKARLKKGKRGYVTISSGGQFGNQLYKAATGIAIALDHNLKYIHLSNKYPEVFKKYMGKLPHAPDLIYRPRKRGYDATKNHIGLPVQPNMQIIGMCLSYKYFHHRRKEILANFGPSLHFRKELVKRHPVLSSGKTTVGLHIRTYYFDAIRVEDPGIIYNYFPAPNLDFVKNAIQLFPKDAVFVVCTDHHEWAKKFLAGIDREFYFTKDNLLNDFYTLSLCHHNILGNSTFSWWAAYLNSHKGKKVIAPYPWLYDPNRKKEDIFPTDWIILPRKEHGCYPVFHQEALFGTKSHLRKMLYN